MAKVELAQGVHLFCAFFSASLISFVIIICPIFYRRLEIPRSHTMTGLSL